MPTNAFSPAQYQDLARRIQQGECVLVLGPHAMSAKQADGSWLPLMEGCALALHDAYKLGLPADEARSLSHVATLLESRHNLSRYTIGTKVTEYYQKMDKAATLHPMFEQLAELPFQIIINTGLDNFFVRNYKRTLTPYVEDTYNYQQPKNDPLYKLSKTDPPLIYNLFGTYENSGSMVLTNSDRLQYIKKVSGDQHARLPDSLLAAFNSPRPFLFLGFDFEDWALPLLMDSLFIASRKNISPFAYPPPGGSVPHNRTQVFFRNEFKMEFPDVDLQSFGTELLKTFQQIQGGTQQTDDSTGAIQAKVLLLHQGDQDDKDAKKLIGMLKQLQLRIRTLADAVGAGDTTAWIKTELADSDIVLLLISVDFFDDANPAKALIDDLVAFHQPTEQKIVMPIVLRAQGILDTTALARIRTRRPTGGRTIYDDASKVEEEYAEIYKAFNALLAARNQQQ
jgi:SIR2-like domain